MIDGITLLHDTRSIYSPCNCKDIRHGGRRGNRRNLPQYNENATRLSTMARPGTKITRRTSLAQQAIRRDRESGEQQADRDVALVVPALFVQEINRAEEASIMDDRQIDHGI